MRVAFCTICNATVYLKPSGKPCNMCGTRLDPLLKIVECDGYRLRLVEEDL